MYSDKMMVIIITLLFAFPYCQQSTNAAKESSKNASTSNTSISAQLIESREERESEDVDCDDGRTIYSHFLKRFFRQTYGYKIMAMLIHFGTYAVESMHYAFIDVHQSKDIKRDNAKGDDADRKKLGLECLRPNIRVPFLVRQKGRTLDSKSAEVFAAMYSNYALIMSILSLKTCYVYYKEEVTGSDVADECHRLAEYLLWFHCIYPFREIYQSNPISNPKARNPAYTSEKMVSKLIDVNAHLHDALNQDFTRVLKESKPALFESTGRDDSEHYTIVDLQILYTNIWKALLQPFEKDILMLHNYFNDAMNINYFAKDIDELVGLPFSRSGMTDVWKILAQDNRKVAGKNAVHLVFHALRTLEVGRMATIMELQDNVYVASSSSFYSLTNVDNYQGIADFVVTL